jgi:hypothetical protein
MRRAQLRGVKVNNGDSVNLRYYVQQIYSFSREEVACLYNTEYINVFKKSICDSWGI